MMPKYFTLGELQKVYEVILNKKLLDPAFRRIIANKVEKTDEMKIAFDVDVLAKQMDAIAAGEDPMQYACQRNYTILSTDGYWNESTTPTQVDGSTSIGDQDGSAVRPYFDGNKTSNTLADVAQYYFVTDIRATACEQVSRPRIRITLPSSRSAKRIRY